MFRKHIIILIVFLAFVFQSCTIFRYLNSSSEEELKKFSMTKDDLWIENEKLKTQIKILKQENKRIKHEKNKETAEMQDRILLLQKQTKNLKEENQKILNINRLIQKKLGDFQRKQESSLSKRGLIQNKLKASVRDIKKWHIKVLNGNGIRHSAKKMAKKLEQMGYQIELIDDAPEYNFSRDTIFYGSKFQDEAELLVSRLGGKSISKPITWPSIFDLIVVTGINR